MVRSFINFTRENPVQFAGFAAFLLLATAYGFHFSGYPPCEMCWWQRYPYVAIVVLAAAWTFVKKPSQQIMLAVLMILFATDATIAAFHAGVEQKWWEGFTSCTSNIDFSGNINDALDAVLNAPVVRWDEIPWSLLGISMAGYNAIAAICMTIFCALRMKGTTSDS